MDSSECEAVQIISGISRVVSETEIVIQSSLPERKMQILSSGMICPRFGRSFPLDPNNHIPST
jgi:hypothetical protein